MNNNYDLWVFGDSFVSSDDGNLFWVDIISKKFNGKDYYISQCDARDIQTIMDSYYKNLYNIKDNSLVIIFLPSLARLRYPKNKRYYSYNQESSFKTSDSNLSNYNNLEIFLHWPYKDYPNGTATDELQFPFNIFDYNELKRNEFVNYLYHTSDGKSQIAENSSNSISPIDFAKLLVANESTKTNWDMIFNSLKKTPNHRLIFYSWTDEYGSDVISKSEISKEVGFWDTKHDEFIETNGNSGVEWDEHFSTKMNREFANLIIRHNLEYFNI